MKKNFALGLSAILFLSFLTISSCKKEAEKANARFVGTYNGTLTENGTLLGAETYTIAEVTGDENAIMIYPILLRGNVSGNSITISSQLGNTTTIYTYGNGNLSGNSLTLNLTSDDAGTISNYVFTGTK